MRTIEEIKENVEIAIIIKEKPSIKGVECVKLDQESKTLKAQKWSRISHNQSQQMRKNDQA